MRNCLGLVQSLTNARDCGFLRYWKLSNVPLFLLAAPMLTILSVSSYITLPQIRSHSTRPARLLLSLIIAQGALAVLTLTSYHVQIVTRLSSAYPVWYIWLAAALCPAYSAARRDGSAGRDEGAGELGLDPGAPGQKYGLAIVTYMVLYATIQTVLFACFMPPA